MKNILSAITISCAALSLAACGEATMQPDTEISAERGKTVFMRCRACHMLEKGKSMGTGPTLHGLFGAKAASKPGYKYSQALIDSGIVWNAETLDTYLKRPQSMVKGTRMAFAGITNDAERASLIKYLEEATK